MENLEVKSEQINININLNQEDKPKKKLNFGDAYKRKDKSKFNDKLWQSEKGTRKFDDETIEINLHPMSKVESSAELLSKEEFIEKEIKFNNFIQSDIFFEKYLKLKSLKKIDQNECWNFIINSQNFNFLDLSEKFMFFTEYFKIKPEKLFKNLDEIFKVQIFEFLKIDKIV